jgi:hypothetical protein
VAGVPRKVQVLTLVTLVTLHCSPSNIAISVSEVDAAGYSPAVPRLRDQSRERFGSAPLRMIGLWMHERRNRF